MSKGKSITLLSIISTIVAFVLVMSFIRFPIGIKNYNSLLGAIDLDYDLNGGVAYTFTLSSDNEEEVENIEDVVDVMEYRLDALGYGAYSVKAIKSTDVGVEDYAIRVETKATDTLSSDIEVIGAHGELKFFGGTSEEEVTTEILQGIDVIKSAKFNGEVTVGQYEIEIEFTKAAYDELMKLIKSEAAYFLKITLGDSHEHDGHVHENVLFQNQVDETYFNKRVMPLYSADETSAKQMVLQIESGGFPYIYEHDGGVVISSPYGEDVALKCAVAIIVTATVLMAVMVVAYKGFGIITALSSLLFILAEGWLLIAVPNIVLNMGGVVGVLSATLLCNVGMTILAKRVKEEISTGKKTAKAAINKAFKKALVPTISINVIAGIVSLSLLAFTSGVVKGFAITFGIGAVVSLISTLVFTRMYNALIMPLVKDKEKFIGVVNDKSTQVEATGEEA